MAAPIGTTTRPARVRRNVDRSREYVVGGHFARRALSSGQHVLPSAIDDVSRDFGVDIYDRMLLDAQLASALHLLKQAILFQGVQLLNTCQQGHPEWAIRQQILEFCQRNLDRLRPSLYQTLYELLDALPYGYKIAEQVWEYPQTGADTDKLCLRAVKVKPRWAVAFVVDEYMNEVGIAALPSSSPSRTTLPYTLSLSTAEFLPRDKFMVVSHRTRDSDPRGTSILRPAFDAWNMMVQLKPEYLAYLSQFASPLIHGTPPPDSFEEVLQDPEGNPVDENGNIITDADLLVQTTPEEAMRDQLIAARNSWVVVTPPGSTVNLLQVNGDGTAFHSAFAFLNEEKVKTMLGATLATGEGKHMARAASQVHQDVLDIVIAEGKTLLAQAIKGEIIERLVRFNYGPEYADYLPDVQLPQTEHQDFAASATAVAALERSGFFTGMSWESRTRIQQWLGMPARGQEPAEPADQQAQQPQSDEEEEEEKEDEYARPKAA